MSSIKMLTLLAVVALVGASLAEAHKKFYSQPIYQNQGPERCVCDCGRPQPVLPNRPYYGSGGYHQPRPSGGGYGNSGSYAVAGSYGSGGGQASGGY